MPNSILNYMLDGRWAITPAALSAMIDIVQRNQIQIDPKIFHGNIDEKVLLKDGGLRRDVGSTRMFIRDKVAVIGIHGPIFPRADLFTEMSGGEAISTLSKDFNKALENPFVHSIIFDIDSPGGFLAETDDFSKMIFAAQAIKPIISVVTGYGASGAYWIGSSSSELVATRTASVGSIGVIAAVRDTTERDRKAGIENIDIISSVSPLKRTDLRTEEGRIGIQKIIDDLGIIFAESVARNRGTKFKDVVTNFGRGEMLLAKDALEVGMIDGISTLENIIERQNKKANSTVGGSFMPKTIIEGTSQDVKTENPGLYNTILEEGKKEGKVEAEKETAKMKEEYIEEGAKAENERIKGIESLDDGKNSKIISENKFNTEMNKGDVAILITEEGKEKTKAKAKAHLDDATALGDQSGDIDASQDGDDLENQRTKRAGNIAAGMNAKRGLKKQA